DLVGVGLVRVVRVGGLLGLVGDPLLGLGQLLELLLGVLQGLDLLAPLLDVGGLLVERLLGLLELVEGGLLVGLGGGRVLLVEVVARLAEVVGGLLLGLLGGLRVVLADLLLGLGLVADRVVDRLGGVRGDGLGGGLGVAGLELRLGLGGGQVLVLAPLLVRVG